MNFDEIALSGRANFFEINYFLRLDSYNYTEPLNIKICFLRGENEEVE